MSKGTKIALCITGVVGVVFFIVGIVTAVLHSTDEDFDIEDEDDGYFEDEDIDNEF